MSVPDEVQDGGFTQFSPLKMRDCVILSCETFARLLDILKTLNKIEKLYENQ